MPREITLGRLALAAASCVVYEALMVTPGRLMALAVALTWFTACGETARPGGSSDSGLEADSGQSADAGCEGLRCNQVRCTDGGTTTLSGTVYAPNGTLPLMKVDVFVPTGPLPAMAHGLDAGCAQCGVLPGAPLISVITDAAGHFTLTNVPVMSGLPVVIQAGTWRKQLVLRAPLTACSANSLATADSTLPSAESDLGPSGMRADVPRIAISTGSADALECLLRKFGMRDSAFSTSAQPGPVHLFSDLGVSGKGATAFANDGGVFADSTSLWSSFETLRTYDGVWLSCEGAQFPASKSQTSLDAMRRYADEGGRLYLGHFHNYWAQQNWPNKATWRSNGETLPASTLLTVYPANPEGMNFNDWLLTAGASSMSGLVPISNMAAKSTCTEATGGKWFTYDGVHSGGVTGVPAFVFGAPIASPAGMTCGKVLFSDVHVSPSSISNPLTPFPQGCSNAPLTPEEKALLFMIFDLQGCERR